MQEELAIWVEYRDGKEIYKIKTTLDATMLFSTDLREAASYAAKNMVFKLEKEVFTHA